MFRKKVTKDMYIASKKSSAKSSVKSKFRIKRGLLIIGCFLVLVYVVFYNKVLLLSMLEKNPQLFAVYEHIALQIQGRTLLGLGYASFFGALFFITFPMEVLFLYYATLDYFSLSLVAIVLTGGLMGMTFNYAFGRVVGTNLLKKILKKNFSTLEWINERFGTAFIFIGNIIPSPIEPFGVLLGATKYPFKKYVLYVFAGRLLKYSFLILGTDYFLNTVYPALLAISPF